MDLLFFTYFHFTIFIGVIRCDNDMGIERKKKKLRFQFHERHLLVIYVNFNKCEMSAENVS